MSIIDLATAKDYLKIGTNDDTHDAILTRFVNGITAAAELYKHEVIEQREITERLTLCGARRFRLWSVPVIPPITSLVSIDGTVSWDVSVFDVDEDAGLVEVVTGRRPAGRFKAVYTAGYATIPENYVQGAYVMLDHLWDTQRGAGQGGFVPGALDPSEAKPRVGSTFTVPNKAKEWLGPPRPVVG